jgi:ATP-dependent Lhr-like helicase
VSNFDLLNPALQHHIVNSLGWRELRPFQNEVIPTILGGEHAIVLAPTAGGKTEAAFFPIASRMLTEGWTGLSVLYVCPIKALLNNLDVRLERYCTLLGRRSTLWHGDVGQSARRRILKDPPDCLLTTPESLEVMLDSAGIDSVRLLSNLRAVVVDEIHAFAGDDRGWHLLSVLGRAERIAGRELQRIGLSATVGNPEYLLEWLAGKCLSNRRIFLPPAAKGPAADVTLDFVRSLENAAIIISRLHRGEKRLVFIDSRARAEKLAAQLRNLDVATFVTHSSLSQEQRRQAEHAFANRDNCVIVATSVLELGIDVGDLDRVVQIDSPSTVSSFLQRMGRTGRRAGTSRNCLFLATDDESLVQAAALIDLWGSGYVEPVHPPPLPYHIYAQQIMALVLQQRGVSVGEARRWLEGSGAFDALSVAGRDAVRDWMLSQEILLNDQGVLSFGPKGEEIFGRRNFLELFSVFLSPPLFTILHGRQELGSVDELTFLGKKEGPRVLLLGGRAWLVKHVDWQRKIAHVEPTELKGQSRWKGEGPGLGFALCQSVKDVLAAETIGDRWSRRAVERLREIRLEYAWLEREATAVLMGPKGDFEWWTFAGLGANATMSGELSKLLPSEVAYDNFALTFKESTSIELIERALQELGRLDPASMRPAADQDALRGLKFSECVPIRLAIEQLNERLTDVEGVRACLNRKIRYLAQQ